VAITQDPGGEIGGGDGVECPAVLKGEEAYYLKSYSRGRSVFHETDQTHFNCISFGSVFHHPCGSTDQDEG
jgi:hypothetical protein